MRVVSKDQMAKLEKLVSESQKLNGELYESIYAEMA